MSSTSTDKQVQDQLRRSWSQCTPGFPLAENRRPQATSGPDRPKMTGRVAVWDVFELSGSASQGPEKKINIKEYFPESGFDVSPTVPGRRATVYD